MRFFVQKMYFFMHLFEDLLFIQEMTGYNFAPVLVTNREISYRLLYFIQKINVLG